MASVSTSTSADASDPEPDDQVEVIRVKGRALGRERERSGEAVDVVGIEDARTRAADLGEVLARTQGVAVRRAGGLGSDTNLSLNGLTDEQVRFFMDGIPLALLGYRAGLANVPVNLVRRAEIYRGVVPIRYGADALGGAVDLVTDAAFTDPFSELSYQIGSFGTHRGTAIASFYEPSQGWVARLEGFADVARNDYSIDVEIPDERGQFSEVEVSRFHDNYQAFGGAVTGGLVNQTWADALLVRAFVTDDERDLQNNIVMTVPYGEARTQGFSAGALIRYNLEQPDWGLHLAAGFAYDATELLDISTCVYDWNGQCIGQRRIPGEIESRPRDQIQRDHTAYARLQFEWQLHPDHALSFSAAPTYVTREGNDRLISGPDDRDPLEARRELMTLVMGVDHTWDLFEGRLRNIAFVKSYTQVARTEEPLPGNVFVDRDRDTQQFGMGTSARYQLVDGLAAELSYEWATRLPSAEEVFGDAVLVGPNLDLLPEESHNVNLGASLDLPRTVLGRVRGQITLFLREASQLIILLGTDRDFRYDNVFSARSLGAEMSAGWTSPGRWLAINGNLTYVDFRNTSTEGTFDSFNGDRVPNQPFLFANAGAQLQATDVVGGGDELSLAWGLRFVGAFFRSWESAGLREFKQEIPDQAVQFLSLRYLFALPAFDLSLTAEVSNLTDENAFDFFGVQRPGRAFFLKTVVGL